MVLLDRHQEGSIETLQHTCRKTPGCSSTGLRCPVEKQQQQQKKPVKGCEKSTAMHQNLNSAVTAEGTCFAAWEHGHLAINSQLYKEQECRGSSP